MLMNRLFSGFPFIAGGIFLICLGCVLIIPGNVAVLASDIYSPLVGIVVCSITILAIRRLKDISPRTWRAWNMIVLAQVCFTLGDIIWAIYEIGFQTSPFPSPADFFYILFYPLFLAGILLIPKRHFSREEGIRRILEIGTALIITTLTFWTLILSPVTAAHLEEPFLAKFLGTAYPTGDVLLIWALISLLFTQSKSKIKSPVISLSIGLILLIATDSVYSIQALSDTYIGGSWLDLGWIGSSLLIAIASVHQYQQTMGGAETNQAALSTPAQENSWDHFLTHVPYFFLFIAFFLMVRHFYIPLPIDFNILAAAVGSIFTLVLIRQMITQIENRRLYNQLNQVIHQVKHQADELAKTNQDLLIEINERKRAERQLVYDGLHDNLTGLPNRILLTDRLDRAIQETASSNLSLYSIMLLDLDDFKVKNESLGHKVGDQLISQIGDRLKTCLRQSDTIARMGGDEFAILLAHTPGEKTAVLIAGRIQEALKAPFSVSGHRIVTTASIGIVPGLLGYHKGEDVLRDADIALYEAKTLGKARYAIFNPNLLTQAMTRMQLENEIRHALESDELRLFYQPIYSLSTETVVGFEALIRWQHPRRGLLTPAEILPVAEETGLIIYIGKWVLQQACSQVHRWHTQFPSLADLGISVNVSGKQFAQPDFPEQVLDILQATGLPPTSLHLEITENIFIENPAIVCGYFHRLRSHGIQLHIDDFQTGYSSLRYLQDFPVQCIKIDKTFVQEIGKNTKNAELVPTMINMAKAMGMDAIAEGVETREQMNELKRLGCPYGQGYLLSRPMDASSAERFLSSLPGRLMTPEPEILSENIAATSR